MRYTYEQPEYLDKVGVIHLVQQLKVYIEGIAAGDVSLSDYVTKSELQAKLDGLNINIDLSSYATKEELTTAINSIDLSAYALKKDIPSLDGYATTKYVDNAVKNVGLTGEVDLSDYYNKEEIDAKIPSLEGYATKEDVDNAVANIPTSGEVDLSNYYTKEETYTQEEVDGLIENNILQGKSAYDVYLTGRSFQVAPFNDEYTMICGEDNIYRAKTTEDEEVGSYNNYVAANDYVRCNYTDIQSALNELVNSGYSMKTTVYYNKENSKNIEYSLTKTSSTTTSTSEPYVDILYCGSITGKNGTYSALYEKGDYFYRFIRISLWDEEIQKNYGVWTPYFAYVYDDEKNYSLTRADETIYVKDYNGNIVANGFVGLKTVLEKDAKPFKLPATLAYSSLQSEYKTQLLKLYENIQLHLRNKYLTEDEWLETLKGEPGTISFDNLTEEQKTELKGTDGYTPVRGTDYWTQEDINTIKSYIDTELGVIENGSY